MDIRVPPIVKEAAEVVSSSPTAARSAPALVSECVALARDVACATPAPEFEWFSERFFEGRFLNLQPTSEHSVDVSAAQRWHGSRITKNDVLNEDRDKHGLFL